MGLETKSAEEAEPHCVAVTLVYCPDLLEVTEHGMEAVGEPTREHCMNVVKTICSKGIRIVIAPLALILWSQ